MSQLWRIIEWFQELSDTELAQLKDYHTDLCKWTKTVNLIAKGTIPEADRIHFADAILGCQVFMSQLPQGAEVWDFGSGNGIPGLVLAILRPDLKVFCLDSDERKIGFIRNVALKLGLKNLACRCGRIEELESESVVFATARGLASLKKLLVMVEKKIVPGGVIFHFKGQEWGSELDEVPMDQNKYWNTALLKEYFLPLDTGRRAILKTMRL